MVISINENIIMGQCCPYFNYKRVNIPTNLRISQPPIEKGYKNQPTRHHQKRIHSYNITDVSGLYLCSL